MKLRLHEKKGAGGNDTQNIICKIMIKNKENIYVQDY
jgi:hypothetical protein